MLTVRCCGIIHGDLSFVQKITDDCGICGEPCGDVEQAEPVCVVAQTIGGVRQNGRVKLGDGVGIGGEDGEEIGADVKDRLEMDDEEGDHGVGLRHGSHHVGHVRSLGVEDVGRDDGGQIHGGHLVALLEERDAVDQAEEDEDGGVEVGGEAEDELAEGLDLRWGQLVLRRLRKLCAAQKGGVTRKGQQRQGQFAEEVLQPVSYTHLTLPTIA